MPYRPETFNLLKHKDYIDFLLELPPEEEVILQFENNSERERARWLFNAARKAYIVQTKAAYANMEGDFVKPIIEQAEELDKLVISKLDPCHLKFQYRSTTFKKVT